MNDQELRSVLLNEYSIEVGRGLGQFAGKVIRIGLMGESCVPANVFALLSALEHILPRLGHEVPRGGAVAAASQMLAEDPAPVATSAADDRPIRTAQKVIRTRFDRAKPRPEHVPRRLYLQTTRSRTQTFKAQQLKVSSPEFLRARKRLRAA